MGTKYKRVLLKISGEALLGKQQFGIDYEPVEMIANEIKSIQDRGVEVAVVVGGCFEEGVRVRLLAVCLHSLCLVVVLLVLVTLVGVRTKDVGIGNKDVLQTQCACLSLCRCVALLAVNNQAYRPVGNYRVYAVEA